MLATKITPYEVQNGPKMHPKMSPKMDPKMVQNGPQERSLSETPPGGPREAQNLIKQTKTTPGKPVGQEGRKAQDSGLPCGLQIQVITKQTQ